jgi:hypothetical protein
MKILLHKTMRRYLFPLLRIGLKKITFLNSRLNNILARVLENVKSTKFSGFKPGLKSSLSRLIIRLEFAVKKFSKITLTWTKSGLKTLAPRLIKIPAFVARSFSKLPFTGIKSGFKAISLRAWLWAGACVILVIVITVPVCQFVNTVHAINLPTDPSKNIPAGGLLAFFIEKPAAAPLNTAPPTPASPGTPAKPRPAAVTHPTTPAGEVPANPSKVNVGPQPTTLVVTYTDYVTYFFNPPVIDKSEVDGSDSFSVYLSANVTLVKDIPFTVNGANLTLDIFATDAAGSVSIPLTISGNSVSFKMPGGKAKSTIFSQLITLRFPKNTPGLRYHLKMNIRDLAVSTALGSFHISFSQPDEMYDLGYIDYAIKD